MLKHGQQIIPIATGEVGNIKKIELDDFSRVQQSYEIVFVPRRQRLYVYNILKP